MQYRKFGKDGWEVSVLGFGAMRLPGFPDGSVDIEQSIRLIRYGIDNGINYVDTAYNYHNGLSEGVVASALRDGYRQKVRIATKSPGHLIRSADDFDRILDEQIRRLDNSKIDYYMFHGIGASALIQIESLKLFSRMEKAKAEGKIGHIGFSFHDNFQAFKQIVDSYAGWDFSQIQLNYMDIHNQAGIEGLYYAASKNIPVIVMEPLLGGRLARPPESIARIFEESGVHRSPAEWSLQWIWNHPQICTVLSGMNSIDQLEQNIDSAKRSRASSLSESDLELIDTVRREFSKRTSIPCTKCRYCLPCPSSVDIPWNIEQYNEGIVFGDPGSPRFVYSTFIDPKNRASACVSCGICENRCPQKIKISEWMSEIHAVLGENRSYPVNVTL